PNTFNGPYGAVLRSTTARLSGPVINLPGGPLNLSAWFERREETIESGIFAQGINATTRETFYTFGPGRFQDVNAWYLEARAPLISRHNARPFARELELQVSVRRDAHESRSLPITGVSVPSRDGPFPEFDYTTARFDSSRHTFALRYAPLRDLALRAS